MNNTSVTNHDGVIDALEGYRVKVFHIGLVYISLTLAIRLSLLAITGTSFLEDIRNPSWIFETFVIVCLSMWFWLAMNDLFQKRIVTGALMPLIVEADTIK